MTLMTMACSKAAYGNFLWAREEGIKVMLYRNQE